MPVRLLAVLKPQPRPLQLLQGGLLHRLRFQHVLRQNGRQHERQPELFVLDLEPAVIDELQTGTYLPIFHAEQPVISKGHTVNDLAERWSLHFEYWDLLHEGEQLKTGSHS